MLSLAPNEFVDTPSSTTSAKTTVFYMKVAPAQFDQTLSDLNRIVPNASVQNLSDAGTSFLQQVTSFLDVIIASLSMIAAIVIIANSVALAMLERGRELGILKSVGYTRR